MTKKKPRRFGARTNPSEFRIIAIDLGTPPLKPWVTPTLRQARAFQKLIVKKLKAL